MAAKAKGKTDAPQGKEGSSAEPGWPVAGSRAQRSAASPSQMCRFETKTVRTDGQHQREKIVPASSYASQTAPAKQPPPSRIEESAADLVSGRNSVTFKCTPNYRSS